VALPAGFFQQLDRKCLAVPRIDEKTTVRAAPFGMDIVFSIYYLAAPLLLIDLRANPIQLGLVGTLASLVHMSMAHLMGGLSDRLGRRRPIITAPLIFCATCLLMTQVREVWVILALSVVNGFCLSIYWPSLQAWIADRQTGTGLARELNIPPHLIGLVLGFLGFALFSGFFLLRKTDRWHFTRSFLFGAQILALAGLSLIIVSNEAILFASAFIMIGLSCSMTYYSSLYYAVHLLKKKGRGSGLHESILGGGAVLGPILGGIAAQYAGLRAPYFLCVALLAAAIGVQYLVLRKRD
jgi:MFS family permease